MKESNTTSDSVTFCHRCPLVFYFKTESFYGFPSFKLENCNSKYEKVLEKKTENYSIIQIIKSNSEKYFQVNCKSLLFLKNKVNNIKLNNIECHFLNKIEFILKTKIIDYFPRFIGVYT